jgi:hypothetical protein
MKRSASASSWRVDVRTFAAGAGCGFLAGALLVATLLWQFDAIRWRRAPSLHELEDPGAAVLEPASAAPTGTTGRARTKPAVPPETPLIGPDPTSPSDLKSRDLLIPVEGVKPDQLVRQFSDKRGDSRAHEAIDILAPRTTPRASSTAKPGASRSTSSIPPRPSATTMRTWSDTPRGSGKGPMSGKAT